VPAEVRAQLSLAAFFPRRMAESDFGSRYSAQSKQEHVMRKVIRGYAKDKNLNQFLLDLYRDLIQPSLRAVCPVLVMPDVGVKLSYPIFGGSKLSG
jgi:hypothetical protein